MGRECGRGGRRRAALRSRTHTRSPGRAHKRTRARTRSLRRRHCVARPPRNGHRDWSSRRAAAVHTVPGRANRDVRYVQRRRYDHLTSNTYLSGGPYYRRCSRSRLRLFFCPDHNVALFVFFLCPVRCYRDSFGTHVITIVVSAAGGTPPRRPFTRSLGRHRYSTISLPLAAIVVWCDSGSVVSARHLPISHNIAGGP